MLQKIFIIILAFVANFIIQWYGNFTGKLSAEGTYLGLQYDSLFIKSVITQFEYLWVLIIINILFTMMFGMGFATFRNFLSLAIIWLAMGPISALIFNSLVLKEQTNIIAILGVFLLLSVVFWSLRKKTFSLYSFID